MLKLRTAALEAVWGGGRLMRCKEMVFTLLVPGHRVDPIQAEAYTALLTLRHRLRARPELRPQFERIWDRLDGGAPGTPSGPVSKVFKIVAELGWSWQGP
jgi:hypothetical protein